MPCYDFEHIDTGEIRELFFKMNDLKEYSGEDGTEVGKWRRKYHAPLASIDTQLDPYNKEQFVRRTERYSTVGDHLAKSKELSDIRAQRNEVDPQKRAFFEKYAAERGGRKHLQDRPSVIENARVKIELD